MTPSEKFNAGYKFAQQENAAAGVYPKPDDPTELTGDLAWQRGYEWFHDKQSALKGFAPALIHRRKGSIMLKEKLK